MAVETPDLPPILPPDPIPPLRHGDRLTRAEFERRYHAMPHVKKAELLEGVVYMPPLPVSDAHGGPHFDLIGWMALYRCVTPGVVGSDNGTLRLDLDNEPQPDAFLRMLASHGGQARVSADGYVEGAPEVVGEVAVSSVAIDLNVRLPLYRRNGVREVILWRVLDREIDWFVLRGEQYGRLPLGEDGIYRSEALPGLWLDPAALVRGEMMTVVQVAQRGLASPDHAAFVRRLQHVAQQRGSV
jgi:hypothetical protein